MKMLSWNTTQSLEFLGCDLQKLYVDISHVEWYPSSEERSSDIVSASKKIPIFYRK
jgi:hypothetical protein